VSGAALRRAMPKFTPLRRHYFNNTHGTACFTLLMLGQNVGEAPDFVKAVINSRGRSSDDVRFAEIAFHAGRFEVFEEFFRIPVDQD
jgi:hypothetical protein